ncbi:hypothetical protein LZC95_25950 [Pendulispora brunnea]|uniref:Uncharacterized protein n=1 Tax=Pendulispora brunnea TaxID=2905690 RepID=A0ABZ2JXB5_9BACT
MSQGALFVGWGSIIAGRERAAANVLGEALGYLERLKAEKTIERFETVLLEPHGGELEGFVLITGDKEKLARLRVDDEFVRVIVGVQLVHAKVGVVGAHTGEGLGALLRIWDEQEEKLL